MQDHLNTIVKFIGIVIPKKEGNRSLTTFPITSNNSHRIFATDKPLSTKFIQNTIGNDKDFNENKTFLLSEYNAKEFEYDNVYNENTVSNLFIDLIKSNLNTCLQGKSNSVILFGSSLFNREEILFDNKGIIKQSVDEFFYLISNNIEKRIIDFSIVIYLNANDRIYDLLSDNNHDPKERNIANADEIIPLIKQSIDIRSKIIDKLGINTSCADMIISLRVNKYSRFYSKYDFIILASSEFGLNSSDADFNSQVYNNFNAIGNNIYSSALGITQTEDSILTKNLGDSINKNSHSILFINCLISNLYPSTNNIKSLQFTNWIRNQIIENISKISLNKINKKEMANSINETDQIGYNPRFTTIGSGSRQYNQIDQDFNFNYGSYYSPNNHKFTNICPSIRSSKENTYNQQSEVYNKTANKLYSSSNTLYKDNALLYKDEEYTSEENQLDSKMDRLKKSKEEIKESLTQNPKIEKLEKTVEQLIKRNEELEKNLNSMREPKPINDSKIINMENENIKQELVILRNDNIILREDVNRLCELNSSMEGDLDILRRKK